MGEGAGPAPGSAGPGGNGSGGMEDLFRAMGGGPGSGPAAGTGTPGGNNFGDLFSSLANNPELAGMMAGMMGGAGGMGMPGGSMGANSMMANLLHMMQSMNQPDENVQLLMALKPHLSPERRGKVDEAIQMMRMMHMLRSLSGPKSEGER